jgi:hypothetical protein
VARARVQLEQKRKHRARVAAHRRALAPSLDAPNTLGWRAWRWEGDVLLSPLQGTPWYEASLRADQWSDRAAVRGQAGIHALRIPSDWRSVNPRWVPEFTHGWNVHGIVERFGRFVLGTAGRVGSD